MTLDQIVKMQSIIDKRSIRSDTLEFLNQTRYSHSKQANIRYGDMHIDHFLKVCANSMPDNNEDKTKEMFESIKKKILQEFGHGNH
jgi:flagellar biosynthesis/type III secretory pathway chaperone